MARLRSDYPAPRPPPAAGGRTTLMVEPCEKRLLLAFSLTKLHVGSISGAEDYDYTAGDKVVPEGAVDSGKFYDIVVTDSSGVRRNAFARTSTSNFSTTD